jgi:CRISPR-associated protein Csh2
MATEKFNNRVFGCALVRSINSNFNADFTHAPRTLPDGTVYATDKALKYAIKDYIKKNYEGTPGKYVLYIKRYNNDLVPLKLEEAYEKMVATVDGMIKSLGNEEGAKSAKKEKGKSKFNSLYNLLNCIDIRLFGATFAKQSATDSVNLSIHGPVQINHAVNKFNENVIYTEDILSPFRTGTEEDDKQNATIGNQTNLQEGHYVYHFSINPANLEDYYGLLDNFEAPDGTKMAPHYLSQEDIDIFKEAMTRAVTYLDSSRKIGSENEMALFVTLKEGSKKVLPGFTELIEVRRDKEKKVVVDATKAAEAIKSVIDEVEKIELYYNPTDTIVTGFDGMNIERYNLLNSQKI